MTVYTEAILQPWKALNHDYLNPFSTKQYGVYPRNIGQ